MIGKLLNSFRRRLFTYDIIYLYELDELIKHNSLSKIHLANKNNIKDILTFQDKKYLKIFEDFLDNNDFGYLAYLDNKCIHRSWVKGNQQNVQLHWGLSLKLKQNEIFIHYCETSPKARGKSIYPHVLSKIVEDNSENRILIAVNKLNIPSIKGIEKVGFKKIKAFRILFFLGKKFIKETNFNKKDKKQ